MKTAVIVVLQTVSSHARVTRGARRSNSTYAAAGLRWPGSRRVPTVIPAGMVSRLITAAA